MLLKKLYVISYLYVEKSLEREQEWLTKQMNLSTKSIRYDDVYSKGYKDVQKGHKKVQKVTKMAKKWPQYN